MSGGSKMSDSNNNSYDGFTISLALVDAIPVLLFGGSSILIGLLFRSPLFITGAVLCFFAGLFKVLWKIILAACKKDVVIFNKQFRYVMCAGFVLIIISIIADRSRISLPGIWSCITSMPSMMFFILGICGMITMGVLGKKLDSSVAKNNWIEQCVNGAAQLCIFLGLLFLL